MKPVHDRIATDLPDNADVAPVIVDDPLERCGKLRVLRNLRDDPLARMYQHKQIDDAQFAAGRLWQRHRENAEIGGARAIDPTIEAVSGGRFKEPDISKLSGALAQLQRASSLLSTQQLYLVYDVLHRGMTITEVSAGRGVTSGRMVMILMQQFRDSLDVLAHLWGFAMQPRSHYKVVANRKPKR